MTMVAMSDVAAALEGEANCLKSSSLQGNDLNAGRLEAGMASVGSARRVAEHEPNNDHSQEAIT